MVGAQSQPLGKKISHTGFQRPPDKARLESQTHNGPIGRGSLKTRYREGQAQHNESEGEMAAGNKKGGVLLQIWLVLFDDQLQTHLKKQYPVSSRFFHNQSNGNMLSPCLYMQQWYQDLCTLTRIRSQYVGLHIKMDALVATFLID